PVRSGGERPRTVAQADDPAGRLCFHQSTGRASPRPGRAPASRTNHRPAGAGGSGGCMRIGIVGSGAVGRALGRGFASRGHEVRIGSRQPQSEELRQWLAAAGARAATGSTAEAAAFGELIVLATAWSGTESAIGSAGLASFDGK